MAGATKRLRRKTTVSQKGCSELMMLTSEWWMQFLFAVGRYISAAQDFPRYRVWRLLSKAWREVWDQGFRLKVQLLEAHYYNLRFAGRCSDDLVFRRDVCNKIIWYWRIRPTTFECCRYCLVSMPWNTFKGLRPILLRMAKHWSSPSFREYAFDQNTDKSFSMHSFVQTAFSHQSEL